MEGKTALFAEIVKSAAPEKSHPPGHLAHPAPPHHLKILATFLGFSKVVSRILRFHDDNSAAVVLNTPNVMVSQSPVKLRASRHLTFDILKLLSADPE
jgi:hypothetical protein